MQSGDTLYKQAERVYWPYYAQFLLDAELFVAVFAF